MKVPADKDIHFTFVSHPTRDKRMRWQAELSFPAGATGEAVLPIHVTDGNGDAIDAARFEFAGKLLPVTNGLASITFADFIAGKHETSLWMHRDGVAPVPGGLTFA